MKEIRVREALKDDSQLRELVREFIRGADKPLKKILLLPPDMTRMHSGAGKITAIIYEMLRGSCQVDIMPALGTHDPMSEEECSHMFSPDVPFKDIYAHNWKTDIVRIGEIPGSYVSAVSDGLLDYSIGVEVNKRLLDKSYDLVISIGQVVPHEVAGMANYTKNIFVGCGGRDIINKSHMLGAVYGMERIMGEDHSPVRKVFDYAQEQFFPDVPLVYILTVTTAVGDKVTIEGLFAGKDRSLFEDAVKLSQEKNLKTLEKRLKKVVVYLDEREFKSTWLGNKAVYRTRMAIADAGELIILAPGVKKFGEDEKIDVLIRKYGYTGRDNILKLYREQDDLKENLSAAAHLIHGSSDGRFGITYAARLLSKEEVEGVGYKYIPYEEAVRRYDPSKLKNGVNVLEDGEEIFYISNPALGLWKSK